MKKGIAAFLILAIAAAGTGGYYYWQKNNDENGSESRVSSTSEDAVYVDSVATLAGLGSGNGLIQRYAGVIEPQQTWDVKLENDRTVKECYVEEGDKVKEGQKLFLYDTTEDEDKLAKAEIDLERCLNNIDSAQKEKEQLEKDKAKAPADEQLNYTTRILTQENEIKQSEYEYKSQQLEISNLKEKIADATVYCELDGIVKSISDPNENSTSYFSDSSDSAYITVLQVGDYRVKGTVNEQNKDQIFAGMEMIVHSRVDESVIWKGTITEINLDKGESNSDSSMYYGFNSDSNGSSSNYPFYVELQDSDGLILGQHVYLEPDLGQTDQKDGIWLDDYYFITENDRTYVWAASSANVLERREVTLGEYDETMATWQVLEGLDAEDYIIVPYEELTEGLPVIYNDYSTGDVFAEDDMNFDGYDENDMSYDFSSDDGEMGFGSYEEIDDDMEFDDEDGMDFYDADADAEYDEEDEEGDEKGFGEQLHGLSDVISDEFSN